MANILGRDIKGEAVILKGHTGRPFIATGGYGLYHKTAGRSPWGYFEDTPDVEVGPLDATYAINVEATNELREE